MNFAQRLFKKTQKMWRGHILMGHQCIVSTFSPHMLLDHLYHRKIIVSRWHMKL